MSNKQTGQSLLTLAAKARQPLVALIEIVVLLALLALSVGRFASVSRVAAGLMLAYLARVAFATALNGGLWWLNRHAG